MPKSLPKLGVIGNARINRQHFAALKRLGITPHLVYSKGQGRAPVVPGVPLTHDWQEFAGQNFDIILITNLPADHVSFIHKTQNICQLIVCEKPLATNFDQLQNLFQILKVPVVTVFQKHICENLTKTVEEADRVLQLRVTSLKYRSDKQTLAVEDLQHGPLVSQLPHLVEAGLRIAPDHYQVNSLHHRISSGGLDSLDIRLVGVEKIFNIFLSYESQRKNFEKITVITDRGIVDGNLGKISRSGIIKNWWGKLTKSNRDDFYEFWKDILEKAKNLDDHQRYFKEQMHRSKEVVRILDQIQTQLLKSRALIDLEMN